MIYTYPKEFKIKSPSDQLNALREMFTEVQETNMEVDVPELTEGEGLFVIPHFKLFGTYNEAVERVITKIKETRPFYNWRDGELGPDRLRQTKAKEDFWKTQPDVICIAGQFGERHKGKSVETVREKIDSKKELAFGAYEVAVTLLTHPERFTSSDDLRIDCAGDEYDYPDDDRRWFSAPVFYFCGDELRFGAHWVFSVDDGYGAASGFFPQYSEPRALNPRSSESLPLEFSGELLAELKEIRKALERIATNTQEGT